MVCIIYRNTFLILALESMTEEDALKLWKWEPTFNDGPIQYDSSSIFFNEDENQEAVRNKVEDGKKIKGRILTSNPVPDKFETFEFTIVVKEGGDHQDIAVGYTTRQTSIVYEGNNGTVSKEYWDCNWNYSDEYFWNESYRKRKMRISEEFCENF